MDNKLEKALTSYSYSKISSFFDCARYFFLHYIEGKKYEGPPVFALEKGKNLHNSYYELSNPASTQEKIQSVSELFAKTYPLEWLKYKTKWKEFEKSLPQGINLFFEQELTAKIPTTAFPGYTYVNFKGYVDYLNLNGQPTAVVCDYKSGKASEDKKYRDQLAIYAYLVFSNFPDIQTVRAFTFDISGNMSNTISFENDFVFSRKNDFQELQDKLVGIIETIIFSSLENKFPVSPCIKCKNCPDYSCKFNKVEKPREEKIKDKIEIAKEKIVKVEEEKKESTIEPTLITPISDREKELLLKLKDSLKINR